MEKNQANNLTSLDGIIEMNWAGKVLSIDWEKMKDLYMDEGNPVYDEALYLLKDKGILTTQISPGVFWIAWSPGSIDMSPHGMTPQVFYFNQRQDAQDYLRAFYPSRSNIKVRKM